MKKHTGKKRPAQYLFALVVFISTLGATQAHAADTTFNCGGTGTYTVTDAGLLTSGQGCTGDLVIDSSVVSIDHYAFYFNPNTMTSVTIPDSVLSVGMWAFMGTTAQVINIGAGLSSISGNAFDSGSIQEFNVSVDNSTFSSSSGVLFNKNKTSLVQYPAGKTATSYTIPSTVTVIESSSFNGGIYLQSVIIPNTVTTLGGGAFQQNNALRSVTIGSGITEITGGAFYNNFGAGITEMIFSSSTNLKKIAGAAFLGARWTSLVVPEGVETIEAGAFNENGYLIDLRLPLTMVTLDDAALAGTGQLTKVCYLGTNTAVIDAIVANGKTVGCVSTPNAPTITGTNAGKSTISVAFTPGSDNGLPITNYEYSLNGATYIALDPASTDSPFVISGLTLNTPYTIRIKASNSLGVGAASAPVTATPTLSYSGGTGDIACGTSGYFTMASFAVTSSSNCVGAVTMPSGTTSIGNYAFEGSGVTSINIPNTVTTIWYGAFVRSTNLTTVTFESGSTLTSIYSAAFERTAIASITLPSSLTFLGNYAFWSNSALTSIVIPEGITALYENSFAYITTLTSVTLPGTLTMIEGETFKGATALESLAIPNRVSHIGANAFTDTTALTMYSYCGTVSDEELTTAGLGGKTKTCVPPISFNCPAGGGTYQVDYGTLIGTTGVCGGALTLDSSVRAIASQALRNNQLTSLTIPESVISIIGSPFGQNGSRSLVSITVAETNPNYSSIDGVLFNKLKTQLIAYPSKKPGTSYTIPSSVTSIRSHGFANSNYLTSVSIPNSVTTLDGETFSNSQVLSTINIGSGLINWSLEDFALVPTLASINVDAANPMSASIDGVLYDKEIQTLYLYPAAKVGRSYVAPNTLFYVFSFAFSGVTNLVTVDLPSVIFIGDRVFKDATSIQEVTFGDALEYLNSGVFQSASNLKKLTLGSGIYFIEEDAFSGNDNFYCVAYTGSDSYIQNFPYPNGVIPVRNSSGCLTPFLKSLTKPKINLKDGKYVCSVGTYVFGYAHDGVIDGSTSGLVTPSKYIYNLLFSGVAQPALAATTANPTNSWSITKLSSGTLISCSVTVTVNSLSTSDLSTENSDGLAAAQSARSKVVKAAEATYKTAAKTIPLIYQKTLVDARAIWRKQTDAIRSNYFIVLDRIAANRGSKMISDVATATELTNAAKAKATADYAANKLAAFLTADKTSKAATDAKTAAIAQANAAYGTHIESIGHGVLIP